jgi:alkylresorcinol/alkylpyrone synthase
VTTTIPRLASLATAVPPHVLGQPEVTTRARHLFAERAGAALDRLMPVFANAGIERRYSSVPIEWYQQPHGWTDRNTLFLENALNLLEETSPRRASMPCSSTGSA